MTPRAEVVRKCDACDVRYPLRECVHVGGAVLCGGCGSVIMAAPKFIRDLTVCLISQGHQIQTRGKA
jgi:hypothetical protein